MVREQAGAPAVPAASGAAARRGPAGRYLALAALALLGACADRERARDPDAEEPEVGEMGEPIRYSSEEQFLRFRDADYVAVAGVAGLDLSAPRESAGTRGTVGPARDVAASLQIHRVLRGSADARRAAWRYQLLFGAVPSLSEGELMVLFAHPGEAEAGVVDLHAVYLNEDSAVPLARADAGRIRDAERLALRLREVDAGGRPLGAFWVIGADGEPVPPALQALADSLPGPAGAGNHLDLFARESGTWTLLETVEIGRRGRY